MKERKRGKRARRVGGGGGFDDDDDDDYWKEKSNMLLGGRGEKEEDWWFGRGEGGRYSFCLITNNGITYSSILGGRGRGVGVYN